MIAASFWRFPANDPYQQAFERLSPEARARAIAMHR